MEENDQGKHVLFRGCHYSYEKQDSYYSYDSRPHAMQARRNYMRTEKEYGYSLEGRTFYVEECNPYVAPTREFTFGGTRYSLKEPMYDKLLDIAKECSSAISDRGDLEQHDSDREDSLLISVSEIQELLVRAYSYGKNGLV